MDHGAPCAMRHFLIQFYCLRYSFQGCGVNVIDKTMMDGLRQWFAGYTSGFSCREPKDQYNLDLKAAHTERVITNAGVIARGEGFDENAISVVSAAALLHDTGRWPQYTKYRTFRDVDSVNHGALGADTIVEAGALAALDEPDADAVLHAVRYHNAFHIAHGGTVLAHEALLCVRDADKLDVWGVLADHYEQPPAQRSVAVGIGLPDTPEYSAGAVGMLRAGKVVMISMISTLNDLKLLQLSWAYDLNYRTSFGLLVKRGLLERIAATLPQDAKVIEAARSAIDYARSKASD